MEQSSSWEADGPWASQEIPHILKKTEFNYRIHKSPSPVHIPSQINPGNAPIPLLEDTF